MTADGRCWSAWIRSILRPAGIVLQSYKTKRPASKPAAVLFSNVRSECLIELNAEDVRVVRVFTLQRTPPVTVSWMLESLTNNRAYPKSNEEALPKL